MFTISVFFFTMKKNFGILTFYICVPKISRIYRMLPFVDNVMSRILFFLLTAFDSIYRGDLSWLVSRRSILAKHATTLFHPSRSKRIWSRIDCRSKSLLRSCKSWRSTTPWRWYWETPSCSCSKIQWHQRTELNSKLLKWVPSGYKGWWNEWLSLRKLSPRRHPRKTGLKP